MTKSNRNGVGPIVSSAHLAQSSLPELSEVEYALTMTNHAFHRWIVRCMDAAGAPGMAPLEVLILHQVNHRDREKTLADIRLVLHIRYAPDHLRAAQAVGARAGAHGPQGQGKVG